MRLLIPQQIISDAATKNVRNSMKKDFILRIITERVLERYLNHFFNLSLELNRLLKRALEISSTL